MNKFTQEETQLLKRILSYITVSDIGITQAVYISPAQRLRNQAEAIEQQERDVQALKVMLEEATNITDVITADLIGGNGTTTGINTINLN